MTLRDALKHRFVTDHGWGDAQMSFLAGDASSRSYDRLVQPDGTRAVLMDAPPDKGERTADFCARRRAWVSLDRRLRRCAVCPPHAR